MSAREASAKNSLVGSRIGKFDVIAEIGTGGMASVYLARSQGMGGFNRLVAIKVMHPHLSQEDSFVEMFLDEARVAATIQHPNVVSIIDVGIEEGLIFLVMEYVEGDSFSSVEKMAVNLRRRIPLGITLRVALDALAGLHCAHELTDHLGNPLRIVHRDVSPQNIVVGVDGVSRIVDFGIAKAESRITTTQVGLIKGKLNFMAPEQIRGGALDRRVDVFGMGVTLWEAVTLRRLFAGENEFDTARRILAGEYPSLLDFDPKLPPVLDQICRAALNPDPDQRFATAADFAEAIERELHMFVAAPREVAAFIGGVATQKLERERRAVRDAAASDEVDDIDDDDSPMTRTLTDAPVGAALQPNVISGVLPSTAMPRAQARDESPTAKKPPMRAPTMSMPAHQSSPRRGPDPAGGTTRPLRVAPTPAAPTKTPSKAPGHEEYDDEGSTAPFQSAQVMAEVRALRGIAPIAPSKAPPPQAPAYDDEDEGSTNEARTVFQPVYNPPPRGPVHDDMQQTVPAPRYSAAPAAPVALPPAKAAVPVEHSMAIDLVQRRVPYGDPNAQTAPPVAQPGDLFGPAPAPPQQVYGAQPGTPGAVQFPTLPPDSTAAFRAPPPSGGVSPAVYVVLSLVLVGVAASALWYVLQMRG